MKKGTVNMGILFSGGLVIISGLVGVIYASLTQRLSNAEAKADTYTADISVIKVSVATQGNDISWIKRSLEVRGFSPKDPIATTSSMLK